jgi:hypothetical protein
VLRRCFNALAVVSLSLCAAVIVLCLHTAFQSHYLWQYMTYANDAEFGFKHKGTCNVRLANGQLEVVRRWDDRSWLQAYEAPRRGWRVYVSEAATRVRAGTLRPPPTALWFHYDPSEGWILQLPLIVAIAVLFVAPALWIAQKAQSYFQAKEGHCLHCGYDLRATPERCPECGTPAVSEAKG